jgi:hypothetical protein
MSDKMIFDRLTFDTKFEHLIHENNQQVLKHRSQRNILDLHYS